MQMNDEIQIAAPREKVFEKLNDAGVLKACIPGCETLEKVSESEMKATVMAKVGPVRSRFNGTVRLSDVNPPESYTISGEGRGGAPDSPRARPMCISSKAGRARCCATT
jgi:carbon monoxide dehydrogenase subunit G